MTEESQSISPVDRVFLILAAIVAFVIATIAVSYNARCVAEKYLEAARCDACRQIQGKQP